jgi:hypothetical protein
MRRAALTWRRWRRCLGDPRTDDWARRHRRSAAAEPRSRKYSVHDVGPEAAASRRGWDSKASEYVGTAHATLSDWGRNALQGGASHRRAPSPATTTTTITTTTTTTTTTVVVALSSGNFLARVRRQTDGPLA